MGGDNISLNWSEMREKGDYRWVSEYSGLYMLFRGSQLLYIGQSNDVKRRLKEHENNDSGWGYYRWASIKGIPTNERKQLEKRLIRRYKPPWNDVI